MGIQPWSARAPSGARAFPIPRGVCMSREMLKGALVAVVAVALVWNIAAARNVVFPSTPRF